jgi:NAD(P)H-hydrate epimerase
MKILSAAQMREADAFTIEREKLAAGELMERASQAFANWYTTCFKPGKEAFIFCGPGNNGGDGLAIARLLHDQDYEVRTFFPQSDSAFSEDFKLNLERLPDAITRVPYSLVAELEDLDLKNARIIDALFGTGINRPVTGIYAETINFLNNAQAEIIAVDVPSGLFADAPTPENSAVIKATYTVSFELPKLAFFLPRSGEFAGHWETLKIGLNNTFLESVVTRHFYTTPEIIKSRWKPRTKFSHKGTFGHALLLAGSYGKIGAAILAANACLRSGVGLLSVALPEVGYAIMQTTTPEAMVLPDKKPENLSVMPAELEKYAAIGIGPGIGQHADTKKMVAELLEKVNVPLVLDADALNILAADKNLLQKLSPETILTPHPKEFERLTESAKDDFHRLEQLQEFCEKYRCYVVMKGAYTCIGTPAGNLYFNPTGNPGMATGGSGDVLTGIITGLRAQKYSAEDACLIGVYAHGLAGDIAENKKSETALIASDIIENLGNAFLELVQE